MGNGQPIIRSRGFSKGIIYGEWRAWPVRDGHFAWCRLRSCRNSSLPLRDDQREIGVSMYSGRKRTQVDSPPLAVGAFQVLVLIKILL